MLVISVFGSLTKEGALNYAHNPFGFLWSQVDRRLAHAVRAQSARIDSTYLNPVITTESLLRNKGGRC